MNKSKNVIRFCPLRQESNAIVTTAAHLIISLCVEQSDMTENIWLKSVIIQKQQFRNWSLHVQQYHHLLNVKLSSIISFILTSAQDWIIAITDENSLGLWHSVLQTSCLIIWKSIWFWQRISSFWF